MAGDFLPPINIAVRADTVHDNRREEVRKEAREDAKRATEQFRTACDATHSAATKQDFDRLRSMFHQQLYSERGLKNSDINEIFKEVFPDAKPEDTGVNDPANQDLKSAEAQKQDLSKEQQQKPATDQAAKSQDQFTQNQQDRLDQQRQQDTFVRNHERLPQKGDAEAAKKGSDQGSQQQQGAKQDPKQAPQRNVPQKAASQSSSQPQLAKKQPAQPEAKPQTQPGSPQKAAKPQPPLPKGPPSPPANPNTPGTPVMPNASPEGPVTPQPGVRFFSMGEPSRPGTGHPEEVHVAHQEAGANFRMLMTKGQPVPIPMPTQATNGETVLGRLLRQASTAKAGSKGRKGGDSEEKSGAVSDRDLALGFRRSMGRC